MQGQALDNSPSGGSLQGKYLSDGPARTQDLGVAIPVEPVQVCADVHERKRSMRLKRESVSVSLHLPEIWECSSRPRILMEGRTQRIRAVSYEMKPPTRHAQGTSPADFAAQPYCAAIVIPVIHCCTTAWKLMRTQFSSLEIGLEASSRIVHVSRSILPTTARDRVRAARACTRPMEGNPCPSPLRQASLRSHSSGVLTASRDTNYWKVRNS